MRLRYTPEAIRDLQEASRYICEVLHNPAAAVRIKKKVLDQCSSLKQFPELGVCLEAMTEYQTDLRLLVSGNYMVLYRIEQDTVSVARILHAKQDYLRFLLPEDEK